MSEPVVGRLIVALDACGSTNDEAARLAARGALFGLLVWGVSYLGWVPAAKILPPAHRDRRDRQVTMVIAHLVFGASLGLLLKGAAPRR